MPTTEDPLVASIQHLQQAASAAWHGREQGWQTQLRDALQAVVTALRHQQAPSDRVVQNNQELQRREISPGVTRAAHLLRHEQEAMFEAASRLVAELEHAPREVRDLDALAKTCADLVKRLQAYCAQTNNLVFDNVLRDTGAGD